MKFLYLLAERLKAHWKNHKTVLLLYLFGTAVCLLFFIYYYGEYTKPNSFQEIYPEVLATYQADLPEAVLLSDSRFEKLKQEGQLTYYHTAEIDFDASSDLFPDEVSGTITYQARENDVYPHSPAFRSVDFSEAENALILGMDDIDYSVDPDKLKAEQNPILILDGIPMKIIGVHNYAYEACVSRRFFAENNIPVNRFSVTLPEVLQQSEADAYAAGVGALFPGASVQTAYSIYGASHLNGINLNRIAGMRDAMITLAISMIAFLFLAKYLFDMSLPEDAVYRLLGASRSQTTAIALAEVILLTVFSATAAILLHIFLYQPLFSKISRYPNQTFVPADYLLVASTSILVCLLVSLPFLFILWKKSVNETRRSAE